MIEPEGFTVHFVEPKGPNEGVYSIWIPRENLIGVGTTPIAPQYDTVSTKIDLQELLAFARHSKGRHDSQAGTGGK
jgi:hypothetical protein